MDTISKEHFLKMLKYRPQSLIGKTIIYKNHTRQIYDISLCGDSILMLDYNIGTEISIKNWYPVDEIDDPVIIDIQPDDTYDNWEASAMQRHIHEKTQGLDLAEPEDRNTVVMVLKAVQNYLLTLPQGAQRDIIPDR